MVEENGEVSLVFEDRNIGQTLHIFDGDHDDAELIGVVMYVRDSDERVTIVHLALHENCNRIYKSEGVNIASIVLEEVIKTMQPIKGIKRIRIYYINREFGVDQLLQRACLSSIPN